ncbi:MAG TPA: hypothetical protein DD473_28485 [Planctomycetaceae bacterium]|nr:hypothetical protein [Planctomycetaceae bacterium]
MAHTPAESYRKIYPLFNSIEPQYYQRLNVGWLVKVLKTPHPFGFRRTDQASWAGIISAVLSNRQYQSRPFTQQTLMLEFFDATDQNLDENF